MGKKIKLKDQDNSTSFEEQEFLKKSKQEKEFLKKFSTLIRNRRYNLKISQVTLAEMTGCHVNSMGPIDRGKIDTSAFIAYKIFKALKITVKFFDEKNNEIKF